MRQLAMMSRLTPSWRAASERDAPEAAPAETLEGAAAADRAHAVMDAARAEPSLRDLEAADPGRR